MKRLLITGGSGFIGGNLALRARAEWDVAATYHSNRPDIDRVNWIEMDLSDETSVRNAVAIAKPDVIIHLAALSNIDQCEENQDFCRDINVNGTIRVTDAALAAEARLISISTDNVFDGERGGYTEDDEPNPINFYGTSKVLAEKAIQERTTRALIVRIPLILGFPVTNASSFLSSITKLIKDDKQIWFVTSEVRSPIDVISLSDILLELANSENDGILHIAGTEALDRGAMGEAILEKLGKPIDFASYVTSRGDSTNRPKDISLDVTRATFMINYDLPDFTTAFERAYEHASPEFAAS